MPFDTVQRYAPIVREIRSSPFHTTILEVGSGTRGLAEYIERKVVGCDVSFGKASRPLNLEPILASVTMLPFQRETFDIVVCLDMLEHIHLEERETALKEMYRVANKMLAVAFPCGEEARLFERRFEKLYTLVGRKRPFLEEHKKYGLPTEEQLGQYMRNMGLSSGGKGKAEVQIVKNANIHVHFILVVLGTPLTPFVRWLGTRWLFKATAWLLGHLNFGETYRRIYLIKKGM